MSNHTISSLTILTGILCGGFISCKPKSAAPVAIVHASQSDVAAPEGMVLIKAGSYIRGTEEPQENKTTYKEEGPIHSTRVNSFYIDTNEVTNAQFAEFVKAKDYKTFAEKGLTREDFPKAPEEMLKGGSAVFSSPATSTNPYSVNPQSWWPFIAGANWRHPQGPKSSIDKIMDHPVVCINHDDAEAYAKWAGKRLPTEAEWEFAARGGLEQKTYAWGNQRYPGKWMANCFQGDFPHKNSVKDGFELTAPVKSFPANGYGLYDMSGNVWEMCSDNYRPDYYKTFGDKLADNPTGPKNPITDFQMQQWQQTGHYDEPPEGTHPLMFLRSVKGGSFLCDVNYCLRYRPSARHQSEQLTPTNHTGFRCVKDIETK